MANVSDHDQYEARLQRLEQRLRQLEYNQRTLDAHVAVIERSIIFRVLRRIGRPILDVKTRTLAWLARSPLAFVVRRLPGRTDPYTLLIENAPAERPPSVAAPLSFCILLTLREPRRDWLDETIASVRSQSHSCWQLRICHDAAPGNWLSDYLERAAAADCRIHLTRTDKELGAVDALNYAVSSAASNYLFLIDPGDRLAPDALLWLATAVPAAVIYSDEDRLDGNGCRCMPVFKPDWSPDLLLSCMYVGRLMVVSRDAWEQAGRFRAVYEAALEYDLLLRVTDRPATIRHVPRVLCHRRVPGKSVPGSVAGGTGPPTTAALIQETLRRRGMYADVAGDPQHQDCCRIHWKPTRRVLASLIVCSRSPRLLRSCLRAIEKYTLYDHREVIVVQHRDRNEDELQAVIDAFSAKTVPYEGPFHYSLMNNLGAKVASGEILVFLNDDIEPIEPLWLDSLVGQVERSDVGVVGARLLYPSGTLQHAGVVIGIGDGCGHIGRGSLGSPIWPWLNLTRDVTAVTGACLAMRSRLFWELGGFSETFPVNYNDVDLCLRVRDEGFRVVFDSAAVLRHNECGTRSGVVTFQERELWYARWGEMIDAGDPFYNPHLTLAHEDLSLRVVTPGSAWSSGPSPA